MGDQTPAKASCLCGKIQIQINAPDPEMGACHCGMCRKWSGGPLLAANCQSDVTFSDETQVKVYSSSDWAERGFCANCGSHLFYRLKETHQYFIPLGLFDTDIEWHFDHQMYTDLKPSYYSFSNKTKDLTEEEVIALFGSE